MHPVLIFTLILNFIGPAKGDTFTDLSIKIKNISLEFDEIDKSVSNVINLGVSDADYATYAESRNKILRFIPEIRKEIARIKILSDKFLSDKLQLQQDVRLIVDELSLDSLDEDSKSISYRKLNQSIDEKTPKLSSN